MTIIGIQRIMRAVLVVGLLGGFGAGLAWAENQAQSMGTQPGPAFTTVDGKVVKIEGNVFTIQSQTANYQNLGTTTNTDEVRIYVGKETKKLNGAKKVGDKIRAEVTESGFANSIQ